MSDPSYIETGRGDNGASPLSNESLKDVTRVNRRVYMTVVLVLGACSIYKHHRLAAADSRQSRDARRARRHSRYRSRRSRGSDLQ